MTMVTRVLAESDALPVLIDPRAAEVASMERAFCVSVFELGIRDGFLRHFSPDGILFRPGPVVATEVLPTRPKSPATLFWTPELADISSAGDLGYTFGPWELRPAGLEDTTFTNGTYATLWRREPDGTWRIALDCGIGHVLEPAKATLLAGAIAEVRGASNPNRDDASTATITSTAVTDLTRGSSELLELDRTIRSASAGSADGADAATTDRIAKDCRFLRADHPPLVGVDQLRLAIGADGAPSTSTPEHAFVSRSADLGYVYGSYSMTRQDEPTAAGESAGSHTPSADKSSDSHTPSADGSSDSHGASADQASASPATESGYFLRIWKKQRGHWQVVLELMAAS